LTDYYEREPETYEGVRLSPWVYAVFPVEGANAHRFETSKYYGVTQYEMLGYFSGRLINFYEFTSTQSGQPIGDPIGGEQEHDRLEEYLEFCVEDWCYRPDPDPVLYKDAKSANEIGKDRAAYQRILREMRAVGAKVCPKVKDAQ
jgi:hypothetical protein